MSDDRCVGGNERKGQLELEGRMRRKFDIVKRQCTDDDLPEPSDVAVLDALIDTWHCANNGFCDTGNEHVGDT